MPEKKHALWNERFPLSNKYDPDWVMEHQMGPNVLWLTEWLAPDLDLKPGMRVLDLGCGMAMSSIFLAQNFGVEVWGVDLWIGATDNWKRIREAGVADKVFPLHIEAHALPFAEGFFDAIVSLDAYNYFGTDTMYLNYLMQFLKPGGRIGIVVVGLTREFENGQAPEHFTRPAESGEVWWQPAECCSIRTLPWWEDHWRQTGLVEIQKADMLEDGGPLWAEFLETLDAAGKNRFPDETRPVREDNGRYLGLVRLVARRQADTLTISDSATAERLLKKK